MSEAVDYDREVLSSQIDYLKRDLEVVNNMLIEGNTNKELSDKDFEITKNSEIKKLFINLQNLERVILDYMINVGDNNE